MTNEELRIGCLSVAKTLDESVSVVGKKNQKTMALCIEYLEQLGHSTDTQVKPELKEETTDDSCSENSERIPKNG